MRGRKDNSNAAPTRVEHSDAASDRRNIGERIKLARRKAGFTQRELAKKLKVSAGAVGQWETGSIPATDRLGTLAALLGISLDWLLAKSGQANQPAGTMEEDLQLIAEARRLGLDLRIVVAEARQRRWIEENRGALADANAFLTRHGLWSDGKRQF